MMVPAGDVSSSCVVESIERWRWRVEGRYMGAVASPAMGHGWSGPFIILAIAAGLRSLHT